MTTWSMQELNPYWEEKPVSEVTYRPLTVAESFLCGKPKLARHLSTLLIEWVRANYVGAFGFTVEISSSYDDEGHYPYRMSALRVETQGQEYLSDWRVTLHRAEFSELCESVSSLLEGLGDSPGDEKDYEYHFTMKPLDLTTLYVEDTRT